MNKAQLKFLFQIIGVALFAFIPPIYWFCYGCRGIGDIILSSLATYCAIGILGALITVLVIIISNIYMKFMILGYLSEEEYRILSDYDVFNKNYSEIYGKVHKHMKGLNKRIFYLIYGERNEDFSQDR